MVPPIRNSIEITSNKQADKIVGDLDVHERKRLFDALNRQKQKEAPCPFPKHKGYAALRANLSPDQQKQMQKNIRISADGKIEIVQMKKKFSILTAEHNGKDIFKGEYKDKEGHNGIKGVTYLTGAAAERVCEEQHKKLLEDSDEAQKFIRYFPGDHPYTQTRNFMKLFGLKRAGRWEPFHGWWYVRSAVFVGLSKIMAEGGQVSGIEGDYEAVEDAILDPKYAFPFVAYERA